MKVTSDHDVEETVITREVPYLNVRLSVKEAAQLSCFIYEFENHRLAATSVADTVNNLRVHVESELKLIGAVYGKGI